MLTLGICALGLSLRAAEASIEWKLKLEGRVITSDSKMIRIRTPENKVIDIVRHSVPEGFDLRPGSLIRWIAPEYKERKPSSSSPKPPLTQPNQSR